MSTHSEINGTSGSAAHALAIGGHGHGAHGGDHVPHVLPLSIYLTTWGALMVLTVITVTASYMSFGTWNLILALGIATTKAIIVAAMFMHLRYDKKFHAIIFSFSLIFLGIFIMFTMYDTETRGRTDAVEHDRPVNVSTPFKGGKDAAALKRRLEGPPPAAAPAAEHH